MIKFVLIALLIFFAFNSNAQNQTNIWELSYSDTIAYPNSEINFSSGNADTSSVYRSMAFDNTDASICDSNGKLLFYTNGIYVGNRRFDTLLNSENFNPGWATTYYGSEGLGACQGAFIIPYPGHPSQYYIFYITGEEFFAHNETELQPLHLSYSVVDMNLGGGLGGIVPNKKNLFIIQDTLTWGRLNGVKHANGRDWWVIMHRYYSDEYYKLLVTPDSIYGPYNQDIGSIISDDVGGQATFSPDGSKFAMLSANNILDYMNFDRCEGNFYDYQLINIPNDSVITLGCSFSPDDRFLYVSSVTSLWQYDTWASNISASGIKIADYDGYLDNGVQVLFFMHQLGPDGRIYLGTFNGVKYLHVINSPDSLGLACNFTQHSITLPQYNDNVPSFPNYDLGALIGSPCDTLNGINQLSINANQFSIYPNPALSQITVLYSVPESTQQVNLFVYDITGRTVGQQPLDKYSNQTTLDVGDLAAGIYLIELKTDDGMVVKKLVVE